MFLSKAVRRGFASPGLCYSITSPNSRVPSCVPRVALAPYSTCKKEKAGAKELKSSSEDVDTRQTVISGLKEKLAFSQERLLKDFSLITAGRASPDLLAKVVVDAYGTKEPITKLAQVAVKDAQTLAVNVFDPSLVKAVADAIRDANLQLNPQIMGTTVKVPVPRVTQEYREMLSKRVAAAAEEAKIAVRKHRHDMIKLAQKNKDDFSKDEMFALEEECTKLTNAAVKTITQEQDKKVAEVSKTT